MMSSRAMASIVNDLTQSKNAPCGAFLQRRRLCDNHDIDRFRALVGLGEVESHFGAFAKRFKAAFALHFCGVEEHVLLATFRSDEAEATVAESLDNTVHSVGNKMNYLQILASAEIRPHFPSCCFCGGNIPYF